MIHYRFIDKNLKYDGSQLKSLFSYHNFEILGNSIVSFEGPCDVAFEHMVDGEDWLARSPIRSDRMLHFIIEIFDTKLSEAVAYQRLFAAIVFEHLSKSNRALRRDGDDIFFNEGKLSVSIATVSPVSALIHFGVNISNSGTPVKTSSLEDLQIDPRSFANEISEKFKTEFLSIRTATMKVRWVP